jgi:hypothetical protein
MANAMETRNVLIGAAITALAVLGAAYLVSSLSATPQTGNAVIALGVLIDLGILILIITEDYLTPFLRRPRPSISPVKLSVAYYSGETLNVRGVQVPLVGTTATELWINVRNEGKTAIKRLRARAKYVRLSMTRTTDRNRMQRPASIPADAWAAMQERERGLLSEVQRRVESAQFGRPLPFSRTPRGTVGLEWMDPDGRATYETDLSPNSDEASVRIVALYPLADAGRAALLASGRVVSGSAPETRLTVFQVGNSSGIGINPDADSLAQEFVVKFWIISENLTHDTSVLLHIEVSPPGNDILYDLVDKTRPDYPQYERLFTPDVPN